MSSCPPPPESLEEDAAQVWCDTLEAYGAGAAKVAGPLLEEYCQAVAIARRARKRVDDEQIIVGDAKGSPIAHPAIAIERRAMETIRRLEDRFKPPLRRQGTYDQGFMVRKTRQAVDAAPELRDEPRYAGAVAATMTLAWIIDESQRAGGEVLRRAAYGPIPTYLKTLEKLGLTPTLQAVDDVPDADGAEAAAVTSIDAWMKANGA